MSRTGQPPRECPVCGAEVPMRARACPGCGADERSGWDEDDARYDGLDLPETAWADENEESGEPRKLAAANAPSGINGLPLYWWLIAVVLLVAVGLALLLRTD